MAKDAPRTFDAILTVTVPQHIDVFVRDLRVSGRIGWDGFIPPYVRPCTPTAATAAVSATVLPTALACPSCVSGQHAADGCTPR